MRFMEDHDSKKNKQKKKKKYLYKKGSWLVQIPTLSPTPTQLIRKQLKHFFSKRIFLSALSKRFLPSTICLFFDSGRNRKLTEQTKISRENKIYMRKDNVSMKKTQTTGGEGETKTKTKTNQCGRNCF